MENKQLADSIQRQIRYLHSEINSMEREMDKKLMNTPVFEDKQAIIKEFNTNKEVVELKIAALEKELSKVDDVQS